MKPTSWNSIPRVFIRFAPIGKVEETRFERNWTDLRQPGFLRCLEKPNPKWWYETDRVEFDPKGVYSLSPRLGKSKKRVLNAIGRPSSTRPFALLGKANPKWLYETDLVEFDPKGVFSLRPDGESRKNAFSTQLDDLRQPGFLRCLEKVTQNGGMKPTSLNSIPRVFFRFALMGKVEKTRFERNWTTFVNPAFCAAWKGPTQNGGMKPTSWNWIPRVFIRFAPMGKVEKTRFERNWTTFVNPAICAAWKSPPKMAGMKPTTLNSIPRVFYSLRQDGESRKNAFSTQLDDLRQSGFLRCLEKPTQNGGMKPTSLKSIPPVFFRFAPIGIVEKTRFQRNWTTFVNPAFSASWKSPPKMVV